MTGTELPGDSTIGVRQVTDSEAAEVTELFALAFYDDPTWEARKEQRPRPSERAHGWDASG